MVLSCDVVSQKFLYISFSLSGREYLKVERCYVPVFIHAGICARTLEGLLRAVPLAFQAQDAFGAVFAVAGIVRDINVHGAVRGAFPAGDAFALVAGDADQGESARWLHHDGNRADILAECAVVMEGICKGHADAAIGGISKTVSACAAWGRQRGCVVPVRADFVLVRKLSYNPKSNGSWHSRLRRLCCTPCCTWSVS